MNRLQLSSLTRHVVPTLFKRIAWHGQFRTLSFVLGILIALSFSPRAQAFPLGYFVASDFSISATDNMVYLNFGVTVSNLESMRVMLQDGAQLEFSGSVDFFRRRSMWLDATVSQGLFSSIIRYNSLTHEFEVVLKGADTPIAAHKRLESVLAHTWHQMKLPLATLDAMNKDTEYYADVELSLRYTDVPPWITKGLLFWSWEVVPDKRLDFHFVYSGSEHLEP